MPFDHATSQNPPHRADLRRVAWVTPDYPPNRGGVSDHSEAMVNSLRAAGHEVLVCTRPHERGFPRLHAELAAFRPDLVIVAYTPLGYAPRTGGIAPAFMRWSHRLRRRFDCQTILLAHETSLPASYFFKIGEFKLAALGVIQAAQFAVLTKSYDAVLFSNQSTQREWTRRLPSLRGRAHTTRICSNIPYHFSTDARLELSAAGYDVPSPTILFFGTGHEAVLFDYLESAFLALLAIEPNARLVIVGMTSERLFEVRPSLAALGRAHIDALGYVAAQQVSLWLQVASLVLIPLIEGVSARKGTVMAALQHGRAVVTTRGANTLEDIPWDEICFLAPPGREAFAATAVQALESTRRSALEHAARTEYHENASAGVTASRIVDLANRLRVSNVGRARSRPGTRD